MKFSSKVEQCNLSPIRKFYPYTVEAAKKGKKIYQLNIGQPDIETPAEFMDAVKHFTDPVLEYAPSPGIPALIEAVKGYYGNLGISLETNDITVTNGGSEALLFTLMSILDDGDEIIIPEPFYPNYNTFVKTTGAKIRPLPTTAENGYRFADKEKLEALINDRTRAIMFTNPGNPTGVVLSKEEMRMIADLAKKHDLFVIGDEVYREFVYAGEPLSTMLEFPDITENAIVIDSVSKRFSACGARIGMAITKNKELQTQIMKFCQGRLSSPTLDQVGSTALYQLPSNYFDSVRDEYRKRRDTIYAKLQKIDGLVCAEPKGAFYVMCKLPVENAEDFLVWLLTEFDDKGETVMFAPGEGFYSTPGSGKSEVRLAYVLKQADLERAMDLLAMGIEQYKKTGHK